MSNSWCKEGNSWSHRRRSARISSSLSASSSRFIPLAHLIKCDFRISRRLEIWQGKTELLLVTLLAVTDRFWIVFPRWDRSLEYPNKRMPIFWEALTNFFRQFPFLQRQNRGQIQQSYLQLRPVGPYWKPMQTQTCLLDWCPSLRSWFSIDLRSSRGIGIVGKCRSLCRRTLLWTKK